MEIDNWYEIINTNINPVKKLFKQYYNFGEVVDVGANVGAFTDFVHINYSKLKIHLFEPAPKFNKFLYNKYKNINQIIVNTVGLSNEIRSAYMHCDNHNLGYNRVIEDSSLHPIQLITFDSYCEKNNLTNIGFIKIDVEEHEPYVLDGMKGYISSASKLPFIVMEHLWEGAQKDLNYYEEIFNWYFNYYEPFDFKSYKQTSDIVLIPKDK